MASPPIEVAKPAVDDAGYDLIVECQKVLRHIQLKARTSEGGSSRPRSGPVSVHKRLGDKPAGCVLMIVCNPDTMEIVNYLWFGDAPGKRLSGLEDCEPAKKPGTQKLRKNTVLVPISRFTSLGDNIAKVAEMLFGIQLHS